MRRVHSMANSGDLLRRIQPTSTALAGAGGTRGSFARCRVVCLAIGARNVKPLAHKQFLEPRNATGLNLVQPLPIIGNSSVDEMKSK